MEIHYYFMIHIVNDSSTHCLFLFCSSHHF